MQEKFDRRAYLTTDQSGTYRPVEASEDRHTAQINADYDVLMRQGYVILEGLISEDQCQVIKEESSALLNLKGRNPFEGLKTQRIYDVLSKTRATDALATHPRILGLMDRFFQPSYLLSQSQIINILPREAAQPLHTDDAFYRLPRPRQPLGAASIWAIDEFTEENGATVIIPESHRWGDDRAGETEDTIPAVMPAGSAIFFLGTTWHGGGANRSEAPRLAVTHQYCEGYLRQQENFLLELSKETLHTLSPELRALVGYSIYPPFMGMVAGMHPLRVIEE